MPNKHRRRNDKHKKNVNINTKPDIIIIIPKIYGQNWYEEWTNNNMIKEQEFNENKDYNYWIQEWINEQELFRLSFIKRNDNIGRVRTVLYKELKYNLDAQSFISIIGPHELYSLTNMQGKDFPTDENGKIMWSSVYSVDDDYNKQINLSEWYDYMFPSAIRCIFY